MKNGMMGRLIGGLVLISIGGIFLLNQMGITDLSLGYLFATYWPVFLILGGLGQLSNGNWKGSSFIGSAILIIIGGYFLANNLDLISLSPGDFFKYFFPLALIVGGLCVLFKPGRGKKYRNDDFPPPPPSRPPVPPLNDTYIPEMESPLDSIFGGLEQEEKKKEQKFKHEKSHHYDAFGKSYGNDGGFSGGTEKINKSGFIGDVHLGQDYFELHPTNISHFIGDTIIDLTKAQIPYGETKINVSAFIGDVKVFIPDDMDIGITAVSSAFIGDLKVLNQKQGGFMSNVQAQSPHFGEASKRVKLLVNVFIGDVKVNMVG
ncbi:lia operon protein LiaF [Fontibacillus phaseoli]|uniref:Lia operon protein LiaF n=1 Tax=Fontibacillus phaseoli TaxID=1416533 RepID=A0A369B7B3_9BACL|nr:cell wall-active antibiotics response protein LiaF [Fontibacillus phaseoli]RCX17410.1 lia operon protein LiaF [Fontibacillus phaseoli]